MHSVAACCQQIHSKSQGIIKRMQQRASKKQLLSSCHLALKSSLANVNELSGPRSYRFSFETGQMFVVETGRMSAVATRQMSTIATGRCPVLILYICLVSTADICPVSAADICPVSTADICPVSTEDIYPVSTEDGTAAGLRLAAVRSPLLAARQPGGH